MSSLPVPVQRWLMILLPPLAIAICCFVLIPRHKKLRQVEAEIKSTAALQKQYLVKVAAIRDLPKDPRIATLPMTKEEQANFLRGLTQLCAQTGNRILSVTSLAAAKAPTQGPPGSPPKRKDAALGGLPPDVVEIKSTIIFEGNFLSVRDFLGGLQRSRRLISLADCRIGPSQEGYPTVQTSVSVVRYVDNPLPPPPAGQPANGAQKAG